MKNVKNTYNKNIGNKIKKYRESAGWSQKTLAEKVGYETSTAISLIESGARKISIEDLEKISEAFHTDIKILLGHKQESVDFKLALRADKDLTKKDKDQIFDFIKFVKNKRSHGN